jgi:hypothetical protein
MLNARENNENRAMAYYGTEGDDVLAQTTLNGASPIYGLGGNDVVDGGAGIDLASYNAIHADANLQKTASG